MNLSTSTNDVLALASLAAEQSIDRTTTMDQQLIQALHYQFIEAAKIGRKAAFILRDLAAQMWLTKGFLELQVPYDNDPTQKLTFGDYSAWIGYAVEKSGLSEATASALKNFILNVVDPVAKKLILNPATGQPFTVEEVLDLRENHTQKLASAARRALNDPDKTDDEKYQTIGEMLEMAKTLNVEDFVDELRARSLSARRNAPIEVKQALAPKKIVYMIVIDEDQQAIMNMLLDGRTTLRTKTVDDLMSDLMAIQVTDAALNNVSSIENDGLVDLGQVEETEVTTWLEEQ